MKLKRLLKAGAQYLLDPKFRFLMDCKRGRFDRMDDEAYLRLKFRMVTGRELDLQAPKTFNEKLQWLKLFDRDPAYPAMADKVEAKAYVAERLGPECIIPTLGVWDRASDIDFDALPEQFVLKCSHNSGLGMCICRDKAALDIPQVRQALDRGLRQDYFSAGREWPYKSIRPRILAEAFLSCPAGELADYKLHCFHGEPKFILVCRDRFAASGLTIDFFTPRWEHLPVSRPGIPHAAQAIPAPERLEAMLSMARVLAKDIPFVRVDLYCVEGKIYFSELTFFPASGFVPFAPESWDETFGSWLQLPDKEETTC